MIDVYASFAALLNHPLEAGIAPDSRDQLSNFLGTDTAGCDYIVQQNLDNTLSIIQGDWKYIEPSNKPALEYWTKTEMGKRPTASTVQSFHRSVRKRQCGRSSSGQGKSPLHPTERGEGSKESKRKEIKVQECGCSQVLYEFVLFANY